MKQAMILAAGMGSRLKPLTDKTPKALIPFHGKPLLEWLILKLKHDGYTRLVINTHHLAGQIDSFLKSKNNFGLAVTLSYEEQLLDTGGAIKRAIPFLDNSIPLLVHNADILSDIPFSALENHHRASAAHVTLAVNNRTTSRYFRFTSDGLLCGWENTRNGATKGTCPEPFVKYAFCGIHLLNPAVWHAFPDQDIFSMVPFYVEQAARFKIRAYNVDKWRWADLGTPDKLKNARLLFTPESLCC